VSSGIDGIDGVPHKYGIEGIELPEKIREDMEARPNSEIPQKHQCRQQLARL
jgi:hypothetical protein